MKILMLFILFPVLCWGTVAGQNTMTLPFLLEKAVEMAPDAGAKAIYQSNLEAGLENVNNNYLPSVSLNMQASWQSQVTEIDMSGLPFPVDIPVPDKDQYKAVLQVNQVLYDAGMSKYLKLLHEKTFEINSAGTAVAMMSLKTRVASLFYAAVLLNDQVRISKLLLGNLEKNINNLESGLTNGVIKQADLDLMQVEMIRLKQKIAEAESKQAYIFKAIEELTGQAISPGQELSSGVEEIGQTATIDYSNRPEKMLFKLQKESLALNSGLIQRSHYPTVGLFGQAGYGKPGLNFLSDQFNPYFIGGVSLNWNFFDWNETRNKQLMLDNQAKLIDIKEQNFDRNIRLLLQEKLNEIEKYKKLIEQDEEILKLLETVEKTAASELANGVISASEYLVEMNRKLEAEISKVFHEAMLQQSMANFQLISGKI